MSSVVDTELPLMFLASCSVPSLELDWLFKESPGL